MNGTEVVATTADPAFAVDRDGQIIAWNSGAEQCLGYRRSEVEGHPLGPEGRPVPQQGFDPRGEWPVEMAGWIEPSAVDALWAVKLQVQRASDLTLAITRGQGAVVETLAGGTFAPR